jgi:hypothetical protein
MKLIKASTILCVGAFCFFSHDFCLRCVAQRFTFRAYLMCADVVKLVDTLDLGSSGLAPVGVRVPPSAPKFCKMVAVPNGSLFFYVSEASSKTSSGLAPWSAMRCCRWEISWLAVRRRWERVVMRLRDMAISMGGLRRMNMSSFALLKTSNEDVSLAKTVAERGSPVKIPISPTGAMGLILAN